MRATGTVAETVAREQTLENGQRGLFSLGTSLPPAMPAAARGSMKGGSISRADPAGRIQQGGSSRADQSCPAYRRMESSESTGIQREASSSWRSVGCLALA